MMVVNIVLRLVIVGMSHVGDAICMRTTMETITAFFFMVCQAVQIWS
jgi:phage-related holin